MVTLPSCHYFINLTDEEDDGFCVRQFHFHWGKDSNVGSEHSIEGNFFPLEVRLPFGLFVCCFLFNLFRCTL